MSKIKSFRGKILDGNQDIIPLKTNNGSTGYKIVKFQILPTNTTSGTNEAMVSIFKISQSTAPQDVNFSDNTLLAAAFYLRDQATVASTSQTIIFDGEIFNQDIYVNYSDAQGSTGEMNYYIELEQMKLSLDESTVATLKDIRNIKSNE
jgi:hypothetical protein